MEQKLRVALLAGGKSGERDVSLKGASEVKKALDSKKYDVQQYDPATDLPKLAVDAGNIDFAFILLHGPFGEDGTMQGMLDLLEIPYQGAGVLGSAMAMDKNVAKIMYQRAGLTVPAWVMVTRGQEFDAVASRPGISLGSPRVHTSPVRQERQRVSRALRANRAVAIHRVGRRPPRPATLRSPKRPG